MKTEGLQTADLLRSISELTRDLAATRKAFAVLLIKAGGTITLTRKEMLVDPRGSIERSSDMAGVTYRWVERKS